MPPMANADKGMITVFRAVNGLVTFSVAILSDGYLGMPATACNLIHAEQRRPLLQSTTGPIRDKPG